jgi:hypothetical protein
MPIADDILSIKNHVDTMLPSANSFSVTKAKIQSLKYYRDKKVIPGKISLIKAVSPGGSFSSQSDPDVAAINVEIANLETVLENNFLPEGTEF